MYTKLQGISLKPVCAILLCFSSSLRWLIFKIFWSWSCLWYPEQYKSKSATCQFLYVCSVWQLHPEFIFDMIIHKNPRKIDKEPTTNSGTELQLIYSCNSIELEAGSFCIFLARIRHWAWTAVVYNNNVCSKYIVPVSWGWPNITSDLAKPWTRWGAHSSPGPGEPTQSPLMASPGGWNISAKLLQSLQPQVSLTKSLSWMQWMKYFQHRCFSARGTASRSPQCVWSPECGRSRPASSWSWLRPPSAACVWILSLHSQRWRKKGLLGRKLSFILCKSGWDISGKLLLLIWLSWSSQDITWQTDGHSI